MTFKYWVRPVVVIVAGIGLAGCGAKQPPETQVDKHPWEVRVESPLDTIQVTPETQTTAQTVPSETQVTTGMETPVVTETAAAMPASGNTATPAVQTSMPDSKSFIPGWRVQIHAFPTMASAEAAAVKARQRFTEPVYVEYQAPMYKVRVGDFLTKDDARHMVNRAKAENYAQAWVVEDLVMRPGN
jgi:cell division septation protein DedD